MSLNLYHHALLTYFLLLTNYNPSFSYLTSLPIKHHNQIAPTFHQHTNTALSSSILEEILSDEELETTKPDLNALSITEIKTTLLEKLQASTILKEDLEYISDLVNVLEQKYVPVQTLEFLNFAMEGDWELLLSTNQLGKPQRELMLGAIHQNVQTNEDSGNITNTASWEYSEQTPSTPKYSKGIFKIEASYTFQSTGRMVFELQNHVVKPIGNEIPSDVPRLVSLLYKSIPLEFFDPNNLGMDVTFMDDRVKIVRISSGDGGALDGVRNIFVRKE